MMDCLKTAERQCSHSSANVPHAPLHSKGHADHTSITLFFKKFSKIDCAGGQFLVPHACGAAVSASRVQRSTGSCHCRETVVVAAPGVETASSFCDLRETRGTCLQTSSTFFPSHTLPRTWPSLGKPAVPTWSPRCGPQAGCHPLCPPSASALNQLWPA